MDVAGGAGAGGRGEFELCGIPGHMHKPTLSLEALRSVLLGRQHGAHALDGLVERLQIVVDGALQDPVSVRKWRWAR